MLFAPLAGETANGNFPDKAVSTMAAIVANAEVGVNYYQVSRGHPLPCNVHLGCVTLVAC